MSAPARDRHRGSLVIARVSGIPIRVHPTFLILVVLVALSIDPLAMTLTLVMVFASVTLHELAHALVAQRRAIVVRDILLLPIGGVSELERLPDRPADQLAVAAAGPATSVVIGVVGLGLTAVTGGSVWPIDLVHGSLLHRLGWLNLTLAAFNLLPALPLDGGRVLRAILAPRVGDLRATMTAASLGRAIAVGMIAVGVLFDVWLVIVGVFVLTGAMAEQANAQIQARLAGLVVADLMRPVADLTVDQLRSVLGADVPTVGDDAPLVDAVTAIAGAGQEAAVVVHDGRPVGILELATVQHVLAERREPPSRL